MIICESSQLLVRLCVHLVAQLDRSADADIDRHTIARLGAYLQLYYTDAGKPYGDTKDGFNQWLAELWPTPSAA